MEALHRNRCGQGECGDHRRRRLRDEPRDGRRAHPRAGSAADAPSTTAWWRPTSWATPTTTVWASGWASRRAASPRTWTRCSSPPPPTRPEILLTGVIVNKDGQAVRRRGLLPFAHFGFRARATRSVGVPDRRRGPPADAGDAADQVHRRLRDGGRDGDRARASRRATSRPRWTATTSTPPAARIPTSTSSRNTLRHRTTDPGRPSTCRWAGPCTRASRMGGLAVSIDGEVLREDGSADPGPVRGGGVRVQHRPGRQGLRQRHPARRGLLLRPPRGCARRRQRYALIPLRGR